jgi:hypothetical protein
LALLAGSALDGGTVLVPELPVSEGKYVIEGHGVDPDIVVENDVASRFPAAILSSSAFRKS